MPVEPGQGFPSFTAPSQDGETINLDQYRGDDNLVIFFYPRAGTSG
jgi:peroxiredoxin Q/BCP